MKNGKEIKINNHKNYNLVFGSINNKESKAVFINISTWAEPFQSDIITYNRIIKNINKNIKQVLFNFFNETNESIIKKNNTIVDLDIRESGIKVGKRSFLNCEITLFLNEEIPVTSEYMKEKLEYIVKNLIFEIFENNKHFKFFKRKK